MLAGCKSGVGMVHGGVRSVARSLWTAEASNLREVRAQDMTKRTSQRNTSVQRTNTLLPNHSKSTVRRVPVLGHIERIAHTVILRLQPNLDDLHRRHHGHSFRHTGRQTSQESAATRQLAIGASEQLLVPFVAGETDGHFGDDAGGHGAETFVQGEETFLCSDLDTSTDETAFYCLYGVSEGVGGKDGGEGTYTRALCAAGELHADFYRI